MVLNINDLSGFAVTLNNNQSILLSIGIVIIVAAAIAFIARMLKQDLILAYIVAGILIGPLYFGLIRDIDLIKGLAELGIGFLLFTAGLEMNLKKFKETLSTSALAGIIQVVSVTAVSAAVLIAFKFGVAEAIWVGVGIAFSSTIVVTKLLADRNELNALHSRFIIGIMLVQDIIAILALAMLSKNLSLPFIGSVLLKLVFITFIALLLHLMFLKSLVKYSASSPELLLVVSIALLFFFAGLAYVMNLSIVIGAFAAGIILANNPYKIEISARIKTLRDFFSVMFFVTIGMLLTSITKNMLLLLIPLLAILIFFEPIITALFLKMKGYTTQTSLQVGFSFAQLSEFTLILMMAGTAAGIISQNLFDVLVLTTVISIAITPYTMKLYKPFSKPFEKAFRFIKIPAHREKEEQIVEKKTVMLFGCHLMGTVFLQQLKKLKHKLLVIDFNPDITKALTTQGIDCIYGDASNAELLQRLKTYYSNNLKLIISTLPRLEDNLLLLEHFKDKQKLFIVLRAEKIHEALQLYEEGADYVVVPLVVSAEQSFDTIKKLSKKDEKNFKRLRQEQINYLRELHRFLY